MNLALETYKNQFIKRYDEVGHIKLFDHRDFEGLSREDVEFKSAQGNTLRGGIYHYENYDPDRLLIFCHGIGGGHLHYMREIEELCRAGYCVLAYDNTGCADSEGADIRCLSQSLSDLDSCFGYVTSRDDLKDKKISVIGHSWGGYAAENILNYRAGIEKIVVLSGFVSIDRLLKQYFRGILGLLKGPIVKFERTADPVHSVSSGLAACEKTDVPMLIIHSDDDPFVKPDFGAGYIKKKVKNPKVKCVMVSGKAHNPNYTADAVKYMNDTFGAFKAAVADGSVKTDADKSAFFAKVDWYRMTAQDPEVIGMILDFLK